MAKKKFSEEHGQMPTGDEASARWREFVQRLDALDKSVENLDRSVAELTELGQLILLALRDVAEQGHSGGAILGLVGKVIDKFAEARRDYAQARRGG